MLCEKHTKIGVAFESLYENKRVALLTQHGKEAVFRPLFAKAIACHVERVQGFDTDQLGTFTRAITRRDNQIDTARKKAIIGMNISGLPLGMASEGSFGPDPVGGFIPWNREVIIFIDNEAKIEVLGEAQGPGNHRHLLTASWSEALHFAKTVGFPDQQLILRPDNEYDCRILKNIDDWQCYENAFQATAKDSNKGQVFIETDGRAYANPMRMSMIVKAAENLLSKILSRCPVCGIVGFSVIKKIPGLSCKNCGRPTKLIRAELSECQKCGERRTNEVVNLEGANPMYCDFCNP